MNKKEFIETLIVMGGCDAEPGTFYRGWDEAVSEVLGIAEELDEPETLSQEWIDENKVARIDNLRKMTTSDVVTVGKLKNLLVPKQDKPVIPRFVADYIELNKGWSEDRQEYIEDDSSGLWFALDGNSYGMPNSVSDWLFNEEKVETFAKAWLDGYEVEKEPQWVVRYEDGYFSEEIKFGCGIDGDWVDEVSRAYHFTDKAKAEAVALLIGGTVEEVTE